MNEGHDLELQKEFQSKSEAASSRALQPITTPIPKRVCILQLSPICADFRNHHFVFYAKERFAAATFVEKLETRSEQSKFAPKQTHPKTDIHISSFRLQVELKFISRLVESPDGRINNNSK